MLAVTDGTGRLIKEGGIADIIKAISDKLDAMAKNNGHKRASYLRYLIETHVGALNPRPPARKTEGRR